MCILGAATSNAPAAKPDDARLAEAQEWAMRTPVLDLNPGPQYRDENRNYNMIFGADITPGGRIWAAWSGGGDSELSYLIAATSDDQGKTWSAPRLVIDPPDTPGGIPIRTLVANFWTDPSGRLWLFFDQAAGYFDGRAGVWATICENPDADQPTWSTPQRIGHGVALNKPIVLSTGEWLLPVTLWARNSIRASTERHNPTIDPATVPAGFSKQFTDLDSQRNAHVYVSTDQGKTWVRSSGGVVFPHRTFDEPTLIELRDGRIWMLARTTDGMYESYSTDRGQTWSPPQKRFPHVSARHFVRRLASGRLLMVRHGPIDKVLPRRSHLTAFLSDDDGQTWTGGLVLDERSMISYPDGFQDPDGVITIVYDNNRYGQAEILMARFREEDVLAGKFQSADAKQRMLISKATGPKSKP